MSISQKIEKDYSNIIKSIKNMSNGIEKDLAIGNLVLDIGNRSITIIAKLLGCCYRKVKKCVDKVLNGNQLSLEFRGIKKITEKYPNLKEDIKIIIEKYEYADSHFKTDITYISINPKTIILELIEKCNYPNKFASYNTINKVLLEMGYKLHKIPKTMVVGKIPETDLIFENVNNAMNKVKTSNDNTLAISIDDKATKKIGKISDNGKTWLNIKALDHDTRFEISAKPFGILDLKSNETFVTCSLNNSNAIFKTECIEKYLKLKIEKNNKINRLIIFLDNGPESSGRRKLWLKSLVEISKKYNILIELVYYPPYHSKYNKIERYWARLQMLWNKIIIDNIAILLSTINKTTWMGIKTVGAISLKEYKNGIDVSKEEMKIIDSHILRSSTIKKWSIVITPFSN